MHNLSGAVNLTRYRGGSFERAARAVFMDWGIDPDAKVSDGEVANDIAALAADTLLEAVVKRCIEIHHSTRFYRRPHGKRLPPVREKAKPQNESRAGSREEQLALF